jgi:sugar (pentulose or hexulose) kinase
VATSSVRPRYFIGIDNGSQSSKVTVFDTHGRAVSEGRAALRPYDTPRPGVVEHPDEELDERVAKPYTHTDPDAARVTTSSGYISHRMTGTFRDSAANYAGTWPLDPGTWQWSDDDAEIAKCGIPREMLCDLVLPGDILGEVTESAARHTGIPAGLPVVATANDKAVEALGCGLRTPDTLLVSLGTYVAGVATGPRNVPNATDFWTNYASMPHCYLYECGGVRRGVGTVSWFRDLLGEEAVASARAAG